MSMDGTTLESPLAESAVSFLGFGANEESTAPTPSFTRIRTLPIAIFHVLILIAFEVEIFVNVFDDPRYRFILTQAILMAVLVLSHLIFRHEHSRMRYKGYLELYIKANNVTRITFFWGANMTVLLYFLFIFHQDNTVLFNQTLVMKIVISVENFVLLVLAVIYMLLCYTHNHTQPLPDAALSESLPGLSDGGNLDSSELLKKQAVMIQHLEAQVRARGEELLRQRQTTAKFQVQPRSDDADTLLVAKDQEVRFLKSERDLLRRDSQKSAEDIDVLRQAMERLRKDNIEITDQLTAQKQKYRQLNKEFTEVQAQLEMSRDQHASAQRTIELLNSVED